MIQSYALEEIGRGFFSRNYQVTALLTRIAALFKNHDCFSLGRLIEDTGSMLAGHVFGACNFFELTDMKKRGHITEQKLN